MSTKRKRPNAAAAALARLRMTALTAEERSRIARLGGLARQMRRRLAEAEKTEKTA